MSNKEDSIGKMKNVRLYLPDCRKIIENYIDKLKNDGCVFHDGDLFKVVGYKIMSKDCVEFKLKPELFNINRQVVHR